MAPHASAVAASLHLISRSILFTSNTLKYSFEPCIIYVVSPLPLVTASPLPERLNTTSHPSLQIIRHTPASCIIQSNYRKHSSHERWYRILAPNVAVLYPKMEGHSDSLAAPYSAATPLQHTPAPKRGRLALSWPHADRTWCASLRGATVFATTVPCLSPQMMQTSRVALSHQRMIRNRLLGQRSHPMTTCCTT